MSRRQSRRLRFLVSIWATGVLLFSSFVSLFAGAPVQANTSAVPALRFFPFEGELLINQQVELQIRIFTAGEGVDATDVRFSFTPEMIAVTDGEAAVAGVNLQQGAAFPSAIGNSVSSEDQTGAITAYSSATPLNTGSGYSVVATLLFTPTSLGELDFTFAHTVGSTTDSNIVQTVSSEDILAEVRNARFTIVESLTTPIPTPILTPIPTDSSGSGGDSGGDSSGGSSDTSNNSGDSQARSGDTTTSDSSTAPTSSIPTPTPTLIEATAPTSPDDLPITTDQEPHDAPVFFDDPAILPPAQPGLLEQLQEPAVDLWRAVVESSGTVLDHWVAEIAGSVALPAGLLAVIASAPLLGLLSILGSFPGQIGLQDFSKVFTALGFLPAKKPAGMVFDSHTHQAVPFALLTLQSSGSSPQSGLFETVISDVDGVFHDIQLPPGSYQLSANQGEYRFPTNQERPVWLSSLEFYRGEVFAVAGRDERRTFLVPMDAVVEHRSLLGAQLRHAARTANLVMKKAFFPSALLSVVLFWFFPTAFNAAVLLGYAVAALQKSEMLRRPRVMGQVVDQYGSGVSEALVRVLEEGGGALVGVTVSDSRGRFALRVVPGRYQVLAQRSGYFQPAQFVGVDVLKKSERVQVMVEKMRA